MNSELLAVNSVEVTKAPERILVSRMGQVRTANGDYLLDDEAACVIVEAFTTHGTDVPIDYEHQTLGGQYVSPNGLAPAAGWIKKLHIMPRAFDGDSRAGLFAHVDWTSQARRFIIAKEYRYLSPVLIVRKSDGRAVKLHSAALTNKLAIVGMVPLAAKAGVPGMGVAMDARQSVIVAARSEYRSCGRLARVCTERGYVNDALRQAGLGLVGDAEAIGLLHAS